MNFSTINELVGNTKGNIDKLNSILHVLLSNYRSASEIIEPAGTDKVRRIYLDQLLELNQSIADIVNSHPALHVDKCWEQAAETMNAIARGGEVEGKLRN